MRIYIALNVLRECYSRGILCKTLLLMLASMISAPGNAILMSSSEDKN